MRALTLTVTEIATFTGHLHVRCNGADISPTPGQFYLAAAPGAGPLGGFLRQPIFLFNTPPWGLGFGLDPQHPYAVLEPGTPLDVLGPCGRGFTLSERSTHLLVNATTMPRLLPLIHHALERRLSVTALVAADALAPLPDLPLDVEIVRGAFTTELGAWADVVALDVPDPLTTARTLRALCPMRPAEFVQALLLPPTPCGTGACQACWVETRSPKRRLACTDGPVFML